MSVKVLLSLALCLTLTEATAQVTGSGFAEGSGSEKGLADRAVFEPSQVCVPPDVSDCSSLLWRRNRSSCECGDSWGGIVLCKNGSREVAVLQCYCMFNNRGLGYYVGSCLYGCFTPRHYHNHNFTKFYTAFGENLTDTCGQWNRRGPLCGQCRGNKSVAAYSFSLKCQTCQFHWTNIGRYLGIAYGPLTLFFVIIVVFTVSIHSAPLHGYIFVAQMIATSFSLRILTIMNEVKSPPRAQDYPIAFAATVYGIWNLDFFRFINHHYCLHPSLTTLTVISLDYLIAAYPFIIILITYMLVLLHGRGCKALVFLWRPFNCLFARFRENLDIRTSLVDAFGTFFSLSYVKFLSTTVDLMAPTTVLGTDGHYSHTRVYYDGHLIFMRGKHLRYAVMSLTFFTVFNILPLVLLLLYPRRFFQRRLPPSVRRTLHPFMDILLGIYRDGTDDGADCRYFVVVYPLARIAAFCVLLVSKDSFCFLLITAVMTVTAILVAVIKPYKSRAYNTVDTILVVILALVYASLASFFFASSVSSQDLVFTRVIMAISISLPFLYSCGLTVYWIWVSCKLRRKLLRVGQSTVLCCGRLYLYLVERSRRRQELQAFPSLGERTHLVPHPHRDLND